MGYFKSKRERPLGDAVPLKAALLIQTWMRRHLAKLELRQRCVWNVFQKLRYAAERQQVDIFNFFDALLTHFPDTMLRYRIQSGLLMGDIRKFNAFQAKIARIEQSFRWYKGPHLKFPLAIADIDILINMFRSKEDNILHLKYVGQILSEASRKLRLLPNFNEVSLETSKQVTIVGDLCGHFEDLLMIFHKNGVPSAQNPYVFNGDLVDCGHQSLEVLLVVLALFLLDSNGVFLNRGNHEDALMNARFGFLQELRLKYKDSAHLLVPLIEEVYRFMPLGTMVDQKVLVVHSGISDTMNLDMLRLLDRGNYLSLLCPPVGGTTGYVDKVEWKQIFDIMWSDPQTLPGCTENVERGVGVSFGPNVTDRFCQRYRLDYIVRSSDCVMDGYEWIHDDRMVTVFSAANFYAPSSNKGAILRINPHMDPYFDQYMTSVGKRHHYTLTEHVKILEEHAIRSVCQYLFPHRMELEQSFKKYDKRMSGFIKLNEWIESLDEVAKIHLPWHLLRTYLAPSTDVMARVNIVKYKNTLDLIETNKIDEKSAKTAVIDALTSNFRCLETIFHLLDKDKSGSISIQEFASALELLEKHLQDTKIKDQLLDICKGMDVNADGVIDYVEFMQAFQLYSVETTGVKYDWIRDIGSISVDDELSFESFEEIYPYFPSSA